MNQFFEWIARLLRDARPWVVILAWERAVRTRLGKNTAVLEPGVHLRIPFVDEIRRINTRSRVVPFQSVTVETRDRRVLVVAGSIGFRVEDPLMAWLKLADIDDVLAAYGQGEVARIVSEATFDEVTAERMTTAATGAIDAYARERGLVIEFVRLVEFATMRAHRFIMGNDYRPRTDRDQQNHTS